MHVAERREILRREEEMRKKVEQDNRNTEKLLHVTENTNPPQSSILLSEPHVPLPSMVLPLPRSNVVGRVRYLILADGNYLITSLNSFRSILFEDISTLLSPVTTSCGMYIYTAWYSTLLES